MAVRLQRSWPFALCGLIALVGAAAGVVAAPRAHGLNEFDVVVLALAGTTILAACLVALDPAWILTGGLLLSVFSGNWGNMHVPIPLDRVAVFCGIGATVVRAWRGRDRSRRIEVRGVHWLMLLLVLYAVGSSAWSGTLTSHGPLFALLDRLGVVPFLLFLVAPVAFRTRHQRRILAGGLLVMGGYLGLITLFEALHLNSLVVPQYITDPNLGVHAGRGRGPFLEAGANGLAMFVCGVAAALVATWWRDWRVRTSAGIVIALCAAGILFTLTRQTWVAAAAGTAAAMLADHRLRRWTPLAAGAAAIVVALSLALVPGLSHSVSQRASDQSPVWDRLNSDGAALRMIETRPALGFGWGRFGATSPPYYRLSSTHPLTSVTTAHNMALSNASELGLVGAVLWLVIVFAAIVWPARKRVVSEVEPWRIGLIAVAVAWLIQANLTPLDYAFDNYVIWLWAGIVAMGSATTRERAATPPPTERTRPRELAPAGTAGLTAGRL